MLDLSLRTNHTDKAHLFAGRALLLPAARLASIGLFACCLLSQSVPPVRAQDSLRDVATSGSVTMRLLDGLPSAELNFTAPPTTASSLAAAREHETFWAWDFHFERYYEVDATLRHVSPAAWIYSEDGAAVSSLAVARLARVFEDVILPTLRQRYGPEPSPGIDGNEAITLFMLDVRDDVYYGRAPYRYVSGYFDPANQHAAGGLEDATGQPRRSNEREMIYLDVSPTDAEGLILHQTAAHEFAHLILWGFDPDEETWLAEGLAQLAIHLCELGHPRDQLLSFLARPETPLLLWQGEVRDYGKVYLWMLYLYEQLDAGETGLIQWWIRDPAKGIDSISASLPAGRALNTLLRDFALALYFDDALHGDGRFAFRSLDIDPAASPGGTSFPPPVAREQNLGGQPPSAEPLAPWTIRADRIAADGRPLEVELELSGPACVGAGWRAGAGRGRNDRLEPLCIDGERAAPWLLRPDGNPGSITTVAVHDGESPVTLRVSAAPIVEVRGVTYDLFLPLVLGR